jgi:hypothetical protein
MVLLLPPARFQYVQPYLLNMSAVIVKSSHQIISDEMTTVRVVAPATSSGVGFA